MPEDKKNKDVDRLRERKANDEVLTPEEEKVIAEADAAENK